MTLHDLLKQLEQLEEEELQEEIEIIELANEQHSVTVIYHRLIQMHQYNS